MKSLLQKLNLAEVNSGAFTGPGGWIDDPGGGELISVNPTTGEPIASVMQASRSDL